MRRVNHLFALSVVNLLLLAISTALPQPLLAQKPNLPRSTLKQIRQERREQHRQQWLREHSDSSGQPRPDLWQKGIAQTKQMRIVAGVSLTPTAAQPTGAGPTLAAPSAVAGVQWTQIGPAPLLINNEQNFQGSGPDSGQVTDIAIDPRNSTDQIIYIATDDGGIWKSTDGGTNWTPKTDFMPSLSMGAVALDPGNPSIVYAGTGDLFNNGFFKGVGIYRSIDGGDTWSMVGSQLINSGINRIVLPAANTLLVATKRGLFRSVDGGRNFGTNSPFFNNGAPVLGGFVTDIHLDTASASTVFAAVSGQGIFRSTDSGTTFPTNIFTATNGAPTSLFSYISFAQSTQPDNQTLYASVQDTTPQPPTPTPPFPFKGLYKGTSTDGGATWAFTRMAGADTAGNGCQCGYDQTIGVDRQNANFVYLGFQDFWVSTDGGGSFSISGDNDIHDDHHALVFSPATHVTTTTTPLYVGHDGGISRRDNMGNFTNLNGVPGTLGIATNVLRSIDIGRGTSSNNVYTYGGAQDTGVSQHRPGDAGTDWHLFRDGDGGLTVVDPGDPMKAYSTDDGIFVATTDGGTTWAFYTSAASGLPDCGGSFKGSACASPLAVDPNNSKVVYAASGTQLFQSTDTGVTFTSIKNFSPANVTSLSIVKIDSNTLGVGLDNGKVAFTANALAGTSSTWSAQLSVTGAPVGQPVSGIVIDPSNTSQVVVIYPGFCAGGCASGTPTKHVFMTTNGGSMWTDISGTNGGSQNLPDLPLHSVVIDSGTAPHTIIASSDAAVLRSADLGGTWQVLGVGIPTVDSVSLALDPSASPALLRIGTFGRSTFELTAASGALLAVNANLAFGTVCVGQSPTLIVQLFNVGSTNLQISSFVPVSGSSTDFKIVSGPPTPVTILPGEEIDYTIQFQPSPNTAGTNETATFQINSNDPFQPARLLSASGTVGAPNINTLIANSGSFGNVCVSSFEDLNLTINNGGACPLSLSNITSSSTEFMTASVISFPSVIAPGTSLAVPIRFQPTSFGSKSANITLTSNDPLNPTRVVAVTGNAPPPTVKVTGSGAFGDVCGGTLAEKTIQVCDFPTVGACSLNVTSVALSAGCTDFTLVNSPFPALVSSNSCLGVTVRFTPTSAGIKSCNLVVTDNDPTTPSVTIPLMANTPPNVINIPPDLGFPPTVIQSVGACMTPKPFPISNNGICPLKINNVAIGSDLAQFGSSGLPSLPLFLQPGHVLGDGNFNAVFAPVILSRNDDGTLTVSYESDSITHAIANVTRNLCGEGVRTGARVLVTIGGVPAATVEKIHLDRITGNTNKPIVQTVDQAMNLPLQSFTPAIAACAPFLFHREYGTVSNPIQLSPGSYRLTVTAVVNGKRLNQTVAFDTTTCTFNPNIVVGF